MSGRLMRLAPSAGCASERIVEGERDDYTSN